MYRLQTELSHFRFNTIHNHGPYTVMWYKLEIQGSNFVGVCLTEQERDDLISYFISNPTNFGNGKNYFSCDKEDCPDCGIYVINPVSFNRVKNLILSKSPQLPTQGGLTFPCMDIELLNAQGRPNHNYTLSFDLIGEIQNE